MDHHHATSRTEPTRVQEGLVGTCPITDIVVCVKGGCFCVDPRTLPPPLPFETKCTLTVEVERTKLDDVTVKFGQSFQCAGAIELGLAAALTMLLQIRR